MYDSEIKSEKFTLILKDEFIHDIKPFIDEYPSLYSDIQIFLDNVFYLYAVTLKKYNHEKYPCVHREGCRELWKCRKLACTTYRGSGGSTKFRMMLFFYREENVLELVEFYQKGKQDKENKKRIKQLYDITY